MPQEIRLAIVMVVVLFVVIMFAVAVVWHLRKRLLKYDEYDDTEDSLYTTAQLESLKKEGLIDDEQYQKLMEESREAAKRRARAAKERRTKKTGIFD